MQDFHLLTETLLSCSNCDSISISQRKLFLSIFIYPFYLFLASLSLPPNNTSAYFSVWIRGLSRHSLESSLQPTYTFPQLIKTSLTLFLPRNSFFIWLLEYHTSPNATLTRSFTGQSFQMSAPSLTCLGTSLFHYLSTSLLTSNCLSWLFLFKSEYITS